MFELPTQFHCLSGKNQATSAVSRNCKYHVAKLCYEVNNRRRVCVARDFKRQLPEPKTTALPTTLARQLAVSPPNTNYYTPPPSYFLPHPGGSVVSVSDS